MHFSFPPANSVKCEGKMHMREARREVGLMKGTAYRFDFLFNLNLLSRNSLVPGGVSS